MQLERRHFMKHLFTNRTDYGSFQFNPLDLDNAIPYVSGSSFGSDEDVLLFIEDPGQYLISDETITVLNENTYILPNSNYASSQNILGAPSSPTFSFGGSAGTYICYSSSMVENLILHHRSIVVTRSKQVYNIE